MARFVESTITFPYKRSLGPVVGMFMSALTERRILGIRNGDPVKLTSRRGTLTLPAMLDGRGIPTEGQVFVPFFDEGLLINELTLDAYCPISKQPDYKKCAVRVRKKAAQKATKK